MTSPEEWAPIAACLAAAAAWLLPAAVPVRLREASAARPRVRRALVTAGVAAGAALTVLVLRDPVKLGWVVAAGVVGTAGGYAWHQRRAARREQEGARQVLAACDSLVADLAAGSPVVTALGEAARACPGLVPVAHGADLGGDVASALREASRAPGSHDLRLVAAGWEVAARSGSGLAYSLGHVAEALRMRASSRRVVEAELASARATARLMAGLPVLTWLLGWGTGAHPWVFLFTTGPGVVCLSGGLLLAAVGVSWIDAIARRVEREV